MSWKKRRAPARTRHNARWAATSVLLALLGILVVVALPMTAVGAGGSPAANLDQCGNDPATSSPADGCSGATGETGWVNGNLGASKSVYREGDSIPYRLTFTNLATGPTKPHAVTVEWDTTKSGKHALDYIDTYNQSVLNANPCVGVSGCSGSPNTRSIPADPQIAGFSPIAGSFSLWGGTINSITRPSKVGNTTCTNTNSSGSYCYSSGTGFTGDKSAAITINFTASVANPVLAWGGHIATRKDWGSLNSAVAISGSPYHTRLIDLDGSGGNQDRSLSAAAVIFPGQITIIKDAQPDSSTSFPFTDSGPEMTPGSFNLVDDGISTTTNNEVFSGLMSFGTGTTRTVTETQPAPTHWSLDSITCNVAPADPTNPGTATGDTTTGVATINLNEGDFATCTYVNKRTPNTVTISTLLSATSPVAIGTTVHDTASLSGNTSDAGGTVSYGLFSDDTCQTLVADLTPSPNTVSSGSVPNSLGHQFNSAGTFYFQATYSGDANNNNSTPVSSTCTSETLVVNNPVQSQITPTNTTCQQFSGGTAATLSQLQYSLKGNPATINQVNPGVFFYWIKVTGGGTYTITQTPSQAGYIYAFASGSGVFNSSCSAVSGASITQSSNGSVTVTFTGTGTFYIGIKYDATSVKNKPAPSPTTVHTDFATTGISGSTQGLDLVKK